MPSGEPTSGSATASSLHYFEVHAGFVHHTVNTNNYTRDQVPALLRGIYAYHTQSRGWTDIGYNFVVDRFGRIWEGRYGGVDRPVVGAHTLNYNEYSFAMSALGNYDITEPSSAIVRAYGRLFAWKLSLHGVDASSTKQWVGSRWFQAINGHRDAASTACPGRYLYAKLPRIRTLAKAAQADWSERDRQTSLGGSPWPDLVVRRRDSHETFIVHTEGQLRFGMARHATTGWSAMDQVTVSPDLTGDGISDVFARNRDTGDTAVYPGDGAGGFGAPVRNSHRFAGMDQIVAAGDLNGDGRNDVLARATATRKLFLFRGLDGRFAKRRALSPDWSGYDLTVGTGDLTGDGLDDFASRDKAGKLWIFPGTGAVSLGTPVALPWVWKAYDEITGFSDYTGDGLADLVARKSGSKAAYVYPSTGAGSLRHWYGPFSALKNADLVSDAGDLTGDGAPDLLIRRGDRLLTVPNLGGRNLGTTTATGVTLNATNAVLDVGDWNGDGINDLMSRTGTGRMMFRAGLGQHRFADPVLASTGWSGVSLLAAVGDVTGDGRPDLMGQPAKGAMRIYPGNGVSGFRGSFVAHSAIGAVSQVGAGLWDADGAPDSMFKTSDGSLVLYGGNGPGGLTSGRKIASGMKRYDWVLGTGDLDGNGHSDLLVRAKATGYLWMLPGRTSGVGPRVFVGEGFGGYDLAG